MAIDTIKSSAITDGTIATGDIADDAVTGVKLANDINIAGDLTVTGNDINTAGSMLLRPAGTEIVNINNTGDVIVKGQGNNRGMLTLRAGSNTANSQLRFGDQASDTTGRIMYDHSDDTMRFQTNGSERVRISAAGLAIGGTGAANTLDDYEEGTWTPTFVSTGASFAYSVQGGNYTKVGRLVFANFRIQLSGAPSGSTGSVVFVGGLPFVIGTQVGTYHGGHPGHYFNFNLSQTGTLAYQLPQGDQKVELKVVGDNLGETAVLASHLNSNAQIRGQILYHTA